MTDLSLVIGVIVLFFLRIGIPVLVLIILGTLVDRWQSQRDVYIQKLSRPSIEMQKKREHS